MAQSIAGQIGTGGGVAKPAAEILCPVIRNDAVNGEYVHLVLNAASPATDVVAGQFFQLLCPPTPGASPFFRRPMSVYWYDPANAQIEFLYKVTGAGTRGLAALKPGDTLNVVGPLGVGFHFEPEWQNIVVVGRGVGLATLAPLARAAHHAGVHVTAILSARRPDLLMSQDLFRSVGADVVEVTDSDGSSDPDRVEQRLRTLIGEGSADALFTCGSNRLMLLLKKLGSEHSIPGQVALEQQMACGLGMCFCCVRDFEVDGETVHRRVCWEGPVFDLQAALSW